MPHKLLRRPLNIEKIQLIYSANQMTGFYTARGLHTILGGITTGYEKYSTQMFFQYKYSKERSGDVFSYLLFSF